MPTAGGCLPQALPVSCQVLDAVRGTVWRCRRVHAASSLSERTVWQVIPATPLERVSFIAQARATEEQEITG